MLLDSYRWRPPNSATLSTSHFFSLFPQFFSTSQKVLESNNSASENLNRNTWWEKKYLRWFGKKSIFGRGVIRIRVLRHFILKSFWTHFWGKPHDLYLRSSAAGPCGRWRRLPFHQNQCGRRHAVISVTQFLTLSRMELPRPGGFLSGVTLVTQDHFYSIIGVARAAFWFRLLSWLWPCSPGPCGHHGRVTEDIFMPRNACKKSNENTIRHNQVLSAGLSVYRGPAKVGKKRNRDNPGHLGRRFNIFLGSKYIWHLKTILWILI